jgi:hypothetical protein
MSQNAGRNLERQWRANLLKVLDRQEKAKASWKIACSLGLNRRQPPLASGKSSLIY